MLQNALFSLSSASAHRPLAFHNITIGRPTYTIPPPTNAGTNHGWALNKLMVVVPPNQPQNPDTGTVTVCALRNIARVAVCFTLPTVDECKKIAACSVDHRPVLQYTAIHSEFAYKR
mmetsp:Transcript_35320/g.59965  ORF Transcript_35320/g.59965 Transcript_35320/m.59965 type:complete len:117 (-) Transcript_35320:938-1288(-)